MHQAAEAISNALWSRSLQKPVLSRSGLVIGCTPGLVGSLLRHPILQMDTAEWHVNFGNKPREKQHPRLATLACSYRIYSNGSIPITFRCPAWVQARLHPLSFHRIRTTPNPSFEPSSAFSHDRRPCGLLSNLSLHMRPNSTWRPDTCGSC